MTRAAVTLLRFKALDVPQGQQLLFQNFDAPRNGKLLVR
jgi:hypothetical protein